MKKIKQLLNKYDAHIYAFIITTLFMSLFTVVLLEVINQAFL